MQPAAKSSWLHLPAMITGAFVIDLLLLALTLVACGTAHYACHVAKYWFESLAGLPCDIDIASEFRYREMPLSKDQAALFISLLWLFWPSRRRMALWPADSTPWREALLLRILGSLMPAMYLAFGMSQQFFVHNSGIVFFVFLVVALWSSLHGLERASGAVR